MINIKYLEWDSHFFNYKIGSVIIDKIPIKEIYRLKEEQRNQNYSLLYITCRYKDDSLAKELSNIGAHLLDEKVTYHKNIIGSTTKLAKQISEYKSKTATDELLELVYLSGHESRFKKDPKLTPYFKSMYKTWIDKSITGKLADSVFVHQTNNCIDGFVTIKIKDHIGNIGLIATSKKVHGQGIGKQLIEATENWYRINKITEATVATQLSNKQACYFYENNKYKIKDIQYIYHLWD